MRALDRQLNLVRIFAPDDETLPRMLLRRLSGEGFAGATVTRGYAGFSAERNGGGPLTTGTTLPLVIEVIEDDAHTERLLAILDDLPTLGAFVTVEKVRAIKFSARAPSR